MLNYTGGDDEDYSDNTDDSFIDWSRLKVVLFILLQFGITAIVIDNARVLEQGRVQIKSFIILAKLVTSVGTRLRVIAPAATGPFWEMSQRWRAVGNTVSGLTDRRFEPRISRSRGECDTARPIVR